MYVVHPNHAPRKLTRVSATSFTLSTFARVDDPFTSSSLYPSAVEFHGGRLFYASPSSKVTTIYSSKVGSFDDHSLSPIDDESALQVTIAEISQKIEWLFSGDNSLIVGSSDGIVAVNGGGVGVAITAGTVEATITSAEPCNSAKPFRKDGFVFYVSVDGRSLRYLEYSLLKEAFQASDANFLSYDITQKGIQKIRYKKDKNDIISCVLGESSNGMITCNFNKDENIIGWHNHKTEYVDTSGSISDIAVITDNTSRQRLFSLLKVGNDYFITRQSEYVEFVERVDFFTNDEKTDEEAYIRKVSEQLKECIYLDQSLTLSNLQEQQGTYDSISGTFTDTDGVFVAGDVGKSIVYKTITGYESGRFKITAVNTANEVDVDVIQEPTDNVYSSWYLTFSSLTGLSDYDNTTVSVVLDGGYLSDFFITGGALELGRDATSIVIGYRYKGVIKSFTLGFNIQGVDTQKGKKVLSNFGVRCVSTAGLKVGSSLYRLEDVQKLSLPAINYLPTKLIDGTAFVGFTDGYNRDKNFYIVQDLPLPATITAVILTARYSIDRG